MPLREMRPLGVPFPEPRTAEEEEKVLEEAGSSPLARPGRVSDKLASGDADSVVAYVCLMCGKGPSWR